VTLGRQRKEVVLQGRLSNEFTLDETPPNEISHR